MFAFAVEYLGTPELTHHEDQATCDKQDQETPLPLNA